MKEKLIALLIAKFSGVRQDVLNHMARAFALQVSSEEDANKLVESLTDAQVNEFVKEFRAEVDKEVTNSTKSFEEGLRKKYDLVEKKSVPGGTPTPKSEDHTPEDIANIVKAAVAEAVKPFQEKINGFETENIAKTRLQSLNDKLATCKDETFKEQTLKDFARMQFASDDEFNEYLSEKSTAIETANQAVANKGLEGNGGKPLFAQKEENGVSQGVADFLKSQQPASELSGKEV